MPPHHETRHGPLWVPEGVKFRLWAPSARSVDLLLNDGKPIEMRHAGEGWYEVTMVQARVGDTYMFHIDGATQVPDPASRFQPHGVAGPSELIADNRANPAWQTPPWENAVIYELHVGAFSPKGNYDSVHEKLDYLKKLGVTAIELMPIAAFAGSRGWGYDGVYPFAPHAAYGRPEDLRRLIDNAHWHGIMVFLDVVYNHFGPEGNFLHLYAADFFNDAAKTPWGSAIAMAARPVRDFFIENALMWLNDYNIDGLRFDAVHAIYDASETHILDELAAKIHAHCPGKHLILENDKNEARYLAQNFTAQWNDDSHHALHVLLTGETEGYYEDYSSDTLRKLGRCLTQGFAYQGEQSPHQKKPRGEPSAHLPPRAFVSFLQNHDQIGNRALGERIDALASKEKVTLASAIMLLSPAPPMLFMGEEWGTQTPFLYFCDFAGELAGKIREGRRNEFKAFRAFAHDETRAKIPDPNAETTFRASCLDWHEIEETQHAAKLSFTARMLELRRQHIVPLIKTGWIENRYRITDDGGLEVQWNFTGGTLRMLANFSGEEIASLAPDGAAHIWGALGATLPPWKSTWYLSHG